MPAPGLVLTRCQRMGDQLYGQILEQIVSGRLPEGTRLPVEHDLCKMFGVSRLVVRQVLLGCVPMGWGRRAGAWWTATVMNDARAAV